MWLQAVSGSLSLGADFLFLAQSTPILQMKTLRLREGKGLAQDLKAVRCRAGLAPCPPSHSYSRCHHRSSRCFKFTFFFLFWFFLFGCAVQLVGLSSPFSSPTEDQTLTLGSESTEF